MNNIKVNSQSGQDDKTSSAENTKQRSVPRGDKDFRKLLGERDQSDNDDDNELVNVRSAESARNARLASANQESPKQKKPSLFDLSNGASKKDADNATKDVVDMASADEMMNSPTALYKNLALKEKAAKSKPQEGMLEASVKSTQEEKKQPRMQETTNLAAITPNPLQTPTLSESANKNLETALPSQKLTMQQLVDAIVKSITTLDSQGKTDTTVTLKEPPMFAGSQVVLTSYETAKGEFNIRFENLSQDAMNFMNMKQNQQSLFSALNEKGYTVHIMVATTQAEAPQFTAAAAEQSQQQQKQSDSEDQQQPRKRGQQADEDQA